LPVSVVRGQWLLNQRFLTDLGNTFKTIVLGKTFKTIVLFGILLERESIFIGNQRKVLLFLFKSFLFLENARIMMRNESDGVFFGFFISFNGILF